jgi:hypothetical protein
VLVTTCRAPLPEPTNHVRSSACVHGAGTDLSNRSGTEEKSTTISSLPLGSGSLLGRDGMLEWQLAPFVARGLRAPEGHVRYHAKLVHVVHKCNPTSRCRCCASPKLETLLELDREQCTHRRWPRYCRLSRKIQLKCRVSHVCNVLCPGTG